MAGSGVSLSAADQHRGRGRPDQHARRGEREAAAVEDASLDAAADVRQRRAAHAADDGLGKGGEHEGGRMYRRRVVLELRGERGLGLCVEAHAQAHGAR